jgi:hypothetical protein
VSICLIYHWLKKWLSLGASLSGLEALLPGVLLSDAALYLFVFLSSPFLVFVAEDFSLFFSTDAFF